MDEMTMFNFSRKSVTSINQTFEVMLGT